MATIDTAYISFLRFGRFSFGNVYKEMRISLKYPWLKYIWRRIFESFSNMVNKFNSRAITYELSRRMNNQLHFEKVRPL